MGLRKVATIPTPTRSMATCPTKNKKTFSCDKCDFVTAYLYSFTRHRSNVHKMVSSTKPDIISTPDGSMGTGSATLPSVDTIKRKNINYIETSPAHPDEESVALDTKYPNMLDSLNYSMISGLSALKFKTTDGTSVNLFETEPNIGETITIGESDFITFRKADETLNTVDQTLVYGFENSDHLADSERVEIGSQPIESLKIVTDEKLPETSQTSNQYDRKKKVQPTVAKPTKSKQPPVRKRTGLDSQATPAIEVFDNLVLSEGKESIHIHPIDGTTNTEIRSHSWSNKKRKPSGKPFKSSESGDARLNLRKPVPPILVTAAVTDCPLCSFSSKYRSNTARHFQTSHKSEFQEVISDRAAFPGISKKKLTDKKPPKSKKTTVKKKKTKMESQNNPFLPDTFSEHDKQHHPSMLHDQCDLDNYPSAAQQLAQFVQEENLEMYAADSNDNIDGLNVPLESSFIESILSNVMGTEAEEWTGVLSSGLEPPFGSNLQTYGLEKSNGSPSLGLMPINSQISSLPVSFLQPVTSVTKPSFENHGSVLVSTDITCLPTATSTKVKRNAAEKATCSSATKRSKQTKTQNLRQLQREESVTKPRWKKGKQKNVTAKAMKTSVVDQFHHNELFSTLPDQQSANTSDIITRVPVHAPAIAISSAHVHDRFLPFRLPFDINLVQSSLLAKTEEPVFSSVTKPLIHVPPVMSIAVAPSSNENFQFLEVPVQTLHQNTVHQECRGKDGASPTVDNQHPHSGLTKAQNNTKKCSLSLEEQEKLREVRNAKRREKYHERAKKSLTSEKKEGKSIRDCKCDWHEESPIMSLTDDGVPKDPRPVSINVPPAGLASNEDIPEKQYHVNPAINNVLTGAQEVQTLPNVKAKSVRLKTGRSKRKVTASANKMLQEENVVQGSQINKLETDPVLNFEKPKILVSKRKLSLDPEQALSRRKQENSRRRERRKIEKEQKADADTKQEKDFNLMSQSNLEILNLQQLFLPTPIHECQAAEAFGSFVSIVDTIVQKDLLSHENEPESFMQSNDPQPVMETIPLEPTKHCLELFDVSSSNLRKDCNTSQSEPVVGTVGNANSDLQISLVGSGISLNENINAASQQVSQPDIDGNTRQVVATQLVSPQTQLKEVSKGKKRNEEKGISVNAELKKIKCLNMNPPVTVQQCPSSDCDFETDSRYRLMVHTNFHEALENVPLFIKSIMEATGNLDYALKLQASNEPFASIMRGMEQGGVSSPSSDVILE